LDREHFTNRDGQRSRKNGYTKSSSVKNLKAIEGDPSVRRRRRHCASRLYRARNVSRFSLIKRKLVSAMVRVATRLACGAAAVTRRRRPSTITCCRKGITGREAEDFPALGAETATCSATHCPAIAGRRGDLFSSLLPARRSTARRARDLQKDNQA